MSDRAASCCRAVQAHGLSLKSERSAHSAETRVPPGHAPPASQAVSLGLHGSGAGGAPEHVEVSPQFAALQQVVPKPTLAQLKPSEFSRHVLDGEKVWNSVGTEENAFLPRFLA